MCLLNEEMDDFFFFTSKDLLGIPGIDSWVGIRENVRVVGVFRGKKIATSGRNTREGRS